VTGLGQYGRHPVDLRPADLHQGFGDRHQINDVVEGALSGPPRQVFS
jgi:hypothetical protein